MRKFTVLFYLIMSAQLSISAVIEIPGDQPSIQAGIDAANDFDEVHVAPGIYNENLDFLGKNIKVIGVAGASMTTLRALDPEEPAVLFCNGESEGTEISGFTVTGCHGYHAIFVCGFSYPTISYCIFHGCTPGETEHLVIRVYSNALIKNNLFYGNGGVSCIGIADVGTASIINNTFDNNNRAFHCLNGSVVAINNIVTNSSEYGIYGSFAELSHNCVWNNNPDYDGGASAGIGSISTDPLYIDAPNLDYRLSFYSPCVDAGHPDPQYNDPDGTRNDMGAFPLDTDLPMVININYGPDADGHSVPTLAPAIYWSYYDTAATGQVQYELEVGIDNDWSVAEMWATGQVTSPDTRVTYAGAPLEDRTVYFLRLRLSDGSIWGAWRHNYFYPHLTYVTNVPSDYVRIQEAIDNSLDGDSILVAPGTYIENLDYLGKRIKIIAADGAEVTALQPEDPLQPAVSFIRDEDEGTEFSGFTVTGGEGEHSIIAKNSAYPTIIHCIFHDCNPGNNLVIRVESEAMIRYNLFRNNDVVSCVGVEKTGWASIINNTFDGNRRGFLCLSGAAIAKNNVVTNSTQYGIYGSFSELSYNCVWNNNPDYQGGAEAGIGSISLDPMYLNPNTLNYSLHELSPCIDAGDPAPQYNDPDGSPSDMGAYPYSFMMPIPYGISYGPDAIGQIVVASPPEMYWSYYDTAATTQAKFELEVGTDDDWSAAEVWATGPVLSSDTQVVYGGPPLASHKTYYIRIRVSSGSGWGSWRHHYFVTHLTPVIHVPGDYPRIQNAIDTAFNGDLIIVSAGIYFENISFSGKSITVTSSGGPEATWIQAENQDEATVQFISGETRDAILSGFSITGSSKSGIHCWRSSPTILNNVVTGNTGEDFRYGPGINMDDTHGSMIRGNIIHHNIAITYGPGIHLKSCDDDTICYNIIYGNSGYTEIRGLYSTAAIFNNTISVTTNRAIECLESGSFDVRNNIVIFSKSEAIYTGDGSIITAEHNCLYNNVAEFNFSPGEGNIFLDPLFVDSANGDYSLVAGSPCVDAGDPDPIYNDPDGTRNDIGALWYSHATFLCGDANFDDDVNVGDAVFLINYVFKGGPAPEPLEAGDANCDGESNVGDAVYVINYLFNFGSRPCCP